jgi:hypothetical protein
MVLLFGCIARLRAIAEYFGPRDHAFANVRKCFNHAPTRMPFARIAAFLIGLITSSAIAAQKYQVQ